MIKTSIKGVIPFVQKKRRRTRSCGRRNLRLFFSEESREESQILLNMHGHCKHNSVEEASED